MPSNAKYQTCTLLLKKNLEKIIIIAIYDFLIHSELLLTNLQKLLNDLWNAI